MFEFGKIELIKAVIHVLDANFETPICSSFEVDADDNTTIGFIEHALGSILDSKNMQWSNFVEDSSPKRIFEALSGDMNLFMDATKDLSYELFKLIKDNPDISSGDMVFALFQMDEAYYLAGMKYNYKTMLTRKIEAIREGQSISIIKDASLFASNRHKADEGFIVHLMHMDIALLDKKYEINGEKEFYLKEHFLKCKSNFSEKEKLDIFSKVTKNIENKYIGDDLEKKAKIKKAVVDAVVEDGILSVEKALETAFEETDEIKAIYKEALSKAGIENEQIEVSETALKRKFEIQKIITESGIEVKIPVNYYGDPSKLEFVANGDGTVSLVIKNIGNIQS